MTPPDSRKSKFALSSHFAITPIRTANPNEVSS